MLLIASGVVQVRERAQRREQCATCIQHLNLQGVERGGGGGLGRIDMQPESQGRRSSCGRNADSLGCCIRMSGSVTILPGVPASAVWRLGCGVVDHTSREGPRSGSGAIFKSRIANQLLR